MLNVDINIIAGGGTAPKNVEVGSVIQLDASSNDGDTFEWALLSKPEGSTVLIESISSSSTRLTAIDIAGVYVLRLDVDKFGILPQSTIVSFNAPASISPRPTADDPLFDTGSGVLNFSFELPGPLPGYAAEWDVVDTAGVLASGAGITRGRIIPSNFTVTTGEYAMCLGTDASGRIYPSDGEIFEVSQSVDLTGVALLATQIKYKA